MRKNRKYNPVRFTQNVVALEVLEQKLLMTGLQPSSNVTPPSSSGWNIITSDYQLNTSIISSTPGHNEIPAGFNNGSNYTLRQVVGYYDYVYSSTQDWTVNLAGNTTYTLTAYDMGSGASRGENDNSYGDLDVFAGAYSGMGHLILAAPAGSPATITCNSLNGSKLDRIFNIMGGGSLILQNVIITGGLAKDNGSYPNTDALGGGVLVESGGSLTLKSSTVTQNYAIGSNGPNIIGAYSNTRQAAGYNAAGGGIYGTAGSTITIDSASVVSYNNIRGGKGGNVSSPSYNNGVGGSGGNTYGAGVAINAPASGSVQTTSTYPTNLYLDGGAIIENNQINNVTTQQNGTKIYGGTGGSCAGGKGGSGGSAFGAGLFMSSGALNVDGGSSKTAVVIMNNSMNYGRGYTSNTTSSANVGPNGLAEGGGSYLAPGLVNVANGTASGGILSFANNTANGSSSGLYLPTVSTSDTGFTANNGTWTLRTAVAALNPLVATGMNLTLNLPTANISLTSSSTGTNTGSLAINNTGPGVLNIAGASASTSVINGGSLGNSIFAISGSTVNFSNLTLTGANTTGSGGAINQSCGTLTLNNVTLSYNKAGNGGAYYSYGGRLDMIGGAVIGNSAPTGSAGGLFLDGGMNATFNAVNISENVASASAGWGGGIFQDAGGTLNIQGNTTIRKNTAQVGGGLYITGNLTMSGGAVSNNNATAYGGGFYFSSGTGNHPNLTGVSIAGNTGNQGGGVYAKNSSLKLANSTVSNNNATGNGGGLNFTSGALITISGGSVSGNSAPNGSGGGIYGKGGTLNTSHGVKLSNNTATQGGGAYLANGTATFIGGIVQNNNSANGAGVSSFNNNLNLSGVSVLTNVANGSSSGGYGGGLSQTGGGSILLNNSVVKNNSATYGGGIYTSSSTANFTGSIVKSNNATVSGGGIYAPNNTKSLNLNSAKVSSNGINGATATSGAGIYVSGGTLNTVVLSLKNNTITSTNNGTIEGAGIYANNTTVSFNGGTGSATVINGNQLNSNGTCTGAGVYLTSNASLVQNSIVSIVNNRIQSTVGGIAGNGVGAGIAFGAGASYSGSFPTANLTIGNYGFESPSMGNGFQYNPSNASWTFSTYSGIQGNKSAWGAATAPQGTQTAFLQMNSTISQSIGGFVSGQAYILTFDVAQRSGYPNQSFSVNLGNLNLGTFIPSSTSFQAISIPFVSSATGNQTLTFTGLNPNNTDESVFLDNVQISTTTFSGNLASGGGNDIAFQVGYTVDNSTTAPSYASGINYFTKSGSTGSLRSAINYAQNWMNYSATSPSSMAIILSSSTYTITSSNWQLVTGVSSGDELTIIGGGTSQSTITTDGGGERVFSVGGSGSLVLQNLIVTGGKTVNSGNGGGGGIYLNSGAELTLNKVSVTNNTAGYDTTAANGANSAGTDNGHKANGGNGTNGVNGYGGGIYMAGGTLNLLSNSSISGNTVYGQNGGNGGNGQNGTASAKISGCSCEETHRSNGGNGGYGGTGGDALGGGLYQAGGTLNSPNGSSVISNNTATPGKGGSNGSGGAGGSWSNDPCGHTYTRTSSAGTTPTPNPASGTSVANFDHGGGQTVFTSNASANVQSMAGLYQSGGSISQATLAAVGEPKRVAGIAMELRAEDGRLIAVTKTDKNGRYRFDSDFTGLGYVQVEPLQIFELTDKGSRLPNGVASAFDSGSLKSDTVSFLHGTVVNDNLNLVLHQLESKLLVKGNSVVLSAATGQGVLWQSQLMPKSYHGGFTVSTFDVNNDNSLDYLVITKTGKPTMFIVDGRTGQSTRLAGAVVPILRTGFVVQTANVGGDSDPELILSPSRDRSGRISVIDLKAQKVLWNATDFVLGGMKINVVGTQSGRSTEMSDLQLVSIRQLNNHKVLDGATGKLVETVSERLRLQEIRKAEQQEHAAGGERGEASEQNEVHAVSVQAKQLKNIARVKIPTKRLPSVV